MKFSTNLKSLLVAHCMHVFSKANVKLSNINWTSITLYYRTLVNAKYSQGNSKKLIANDNYSTHTTIKQKRIKKTAT